MTDADTAQFRAARDFLLDHREDYTTAYEGFRWPRLEYFNWVRDWFDAVLVAGWLRSAGVRRGDHLLLMLGNQVELWEVVLAATRVGAVIIPATTLLGTADLTDRVERGDVRHVVARSVDTGKFEGVPGGWTRIAVGDPVEGWLRYADAYTFTADVALDQPPAADDTLLLYFTSGTTARPKLVEHSHVSYPVGHLSTMYWIGVRPGDVHLNISSPGWAKHAWSN